MQLLFYPEAWAAFLGSPQQGKIVDLINDTLRTPWRGLGKPEGLKIGAYRGWWSRRITEADRMIYRVVGKADPGPTEQSQRLEVRSLQGHY